MAIEGRRDSLFKVHGFLRRHRRAGSGWECPGSQAAPVGRTGKPGMMRQAEGQNARTTTATTTATTPHKAHHPGNNDMPIRWAYPGTRAGAGGARLTRRPAMVFSRHLLPRALPPPPALAGQAPEGSRPASSSGDDVRLLQRRHGRRVQRDPGVEVDAPATASAMSARSRRTSARLAAMRSARSRSTSGRTTSSPR